MVEVPVGVAVRDLVNQAHSVLYGFLGAPMPLVPEANGDDMLVL